MTAQGDSAPVVPGPSNLGPTAGTLPSPASSKIRWSRPATLLYLALPLSIGVIAASDPGFTAAGLASYLPTATVDVSYSFLRMSAAYVLSLAFALSYGYYAAAHRTGERVMIPILDILQSVPILGFFPIVVLVLYNLQPSGFGPNLASVILIFTSMSWNMVFGVYESLKTVPSDLREAADTFGLKGWLRFRRLLFPATVNRLVYNSVLSWTGGWFFLVEAEIFTTNGAALPGIGSFLSFAASGHNSEQFLAGLIVLVIVIALLDFLLWRPLGHYAERFRFDQAPSGEGEPIMPAGTSGRFRRAASYVTRGVRTGVTRLSTPLVQLAAITVRPSRRPSARRQAVIYHLSLGTILVLVWLMLIAIVVAVYTVFSGTILPPVRAQMLMLPLAVGFSITRLVIAYAICLAIALPLALLMARGPRARRVGLPIVEVVASFPATALFPVIIFELVPYISAEGAAILMLMTGMIWYLFFNLLSGIRSIPPDLEEAARSFGLKGRKLLRRVLVPGVFTALITGSITAFGGGWNTLIVAEYLKVGSGQSLSVLGVGQLIDIGYGESANGGYPLMVAALFALIATVITINELIWKPLYRRAVERYRYD
ncbi:MAG TPA: ABC transporter permease subunit [Thermoplasmata archaeon]|nr:ABC transporter permease subunit [Thermoplasmata archaeon]